MSDKRCPHEWDRQRRAAANVRNERLARFISKTGRAEWILSDALQCNNTVRERCGDEVVHFVACKADMTPFQGACMTAILTTRYFDGKPLSSRPWTPLLSKVTCGNCRANLSRAARSVIQDESQEATK